MGNQSAPDMDVVLSSRVRLARNFPGVPFPARMNDTQAQEITYGILTALKEVKAAFSYHPMVNEDPLNRQAMVEKHWISPNLAENPRKSALVISSDETLSLMIHEEDHLRVQCILPGFQGKAALDGAMALTRTIEKKMPYAYREPVGYLTCCPTNVGTGMRISFMAHLPALALSSQLQRTLDAVSREGLTIRGLYGEGTSAQGHIFQISNQVTLGVTEDECLQTVENVLKSVMERERQARRNLDAQAGLEFRDRLMRAVGMLRYARKMASKEATDLLSLAWLASDMGYWKGPDDAAMQELLLGVQPAILSTTRGGPLPDAQRDEERAEYIREKLEKFA